LLLRAEDLAKGWLLALLEQVPLQEAPAILAADLARDGPRTCDAVVRALASDADLRRLEPGGALERLVGQAGAFAGAGNVEAVSGTVEALQGVIWSALRGELVDPDADQVSELAERLALVIELLRGAALRVWAERGDAQRDEPDERAAPGSGPRAGLRVAQAPEAEAGPRARGARGPLDAVLADAPRAPGPPKPTAAAGVGPEALWKGALEDEIGRAERSGAPLSLLVVELGDADRVVAVEGTAEAGATFGRFAQAVRSVVRRQDILACESDKRAWIIACDTGRLGAQALGERMAAAVRATEPWRGAPLSVSVGTAVFGEDARDAAGLIEVAEETRFAAEASGVPVLRISRAETDTEPENDPAV
jgi:GGDEF domain-containing protein